MLTCSTEDDANAVAAGLYITGEPAVVMIQHAGLYASVNTLRGIAMDGKIRARRVTGVSVQEQRLIATAVKNAREMALLPYSSSAR